ncbi:MAG TPA: DUF1493 family protein [Roseiarcus sp.]|nr:DUF1493 family protein [Roseiarcus sp.]
MENSPCGELIEFLRQYTKKKIISESTRINIDLHLHGDDAWEVLEWISKRFEVDFQEFRFSEFFHSEEDTVGAPYFLATLLLKKKKPLPISHLMHVISIRRWVDPTE